MPNGNPDDRGWQLARGRLVRHRGRREADRGRTGSVERPLGRERSSGRIDPVTSITTAARGIPADISARSTLGVADSSSSPIATRFLASSRSTMVTPDTYSIPFARSVHRFNWDTVY